MRSINDNTFKMMRSINTRISVKRICYIAEYMHANGIILNVKLLSIDPYARSNKNRISHK